MSQKGWCFCLYLTQSNKTSRAHESHMWRLAVESFHKVRDLGLHGSQEERFIAAKEKISISALSGSATPEASWPHTKQ